MRRSIKKRTISLALAGLLIAGLVVMNKSQVPNPSEPVAPVVPVGASVTNPAESILFLEDQVRKNPEATGYQLSLIQTYLQYAVETRQETFYIPKAKKMLHDLLHTNPELFEARALQASLYNMLHEFEQARDIANSLLEENENVPFLYGILIDALVELGQYEQAVAVCDKMLGLKPGLASYARASYLRELHGDTQGAIEAMKLAADAAVYGSDERSWALYQLGQLYMSDNSMQVASSIFSGILEENPGYAFAIGGLGHIQVIEGNYAEAIELLNSAYEMVPAEEFLEALVEAYEATGDDTNKYASLDRLEQSYHDADDMGENVQMEYADFLADLNQELKKALQLAKKEYERRPDHLHALETYAWSLHKYGRSGEAASYIDRAMRLGTGDAMVYFRAAEIYRGQGNMDKARDYLQKSLDANLHVESPTTAERAQHLYQQLS